jgi:hypothetical protein
MWDWEMGAQHLALLSMVMTTLSMEGLKGHLSLKFAYKEPFPILIRIHRHTLQKIAKNVIIVVILIGETL